jgi:hypothetical protein
MQYTSSSPHQHDPERSCAGWPPCHVLCWPCDKGCPKKRVTKKIKKTAQVITKISLEVGLIRASLVRRLFVASMVVLVDDDREMGKVVGVGR